MRFNKLHIIIAEDDADDGEIIVDSFSQHASFATVSLVRNGKELLDFLKNKDHSHPDLILTDINMPVLNGLDALNEICKDKKLRDIPTFAYSTTVNPIYEAKCAELGTKGFLVKPMEIKGFYDIPNKILEILRFDSSMNQV
jgi:CheY-like chemotaxis protein